jgi:hypothetical protein
MKYFLAGKTENASTSFFRFGSARKSRIVKAVKNIREQRIPVCQFSELAKGMKTRLPKSHIRKAVRRL